MMVDVNRINSGVCAGISELKKNPMAVVAQGNGEPVAILNRNKPAFYAVPAELFDYMNDVIEDLELLVLVNERKDDPTIKVSLDDL
ncbi:MAG: type II toxin-antitoxin system Phd/YefM family antitoxin [Desulfotalea sp.]